MEEPENIDEEIESNVFGSIIHRTMEVLYKDFEGQTIGKDQIDQIRKDKKKVEESVDNSFAKEYFAKPSLTEGDLRGKNLIIRKVIEKYVYGILAFDSSNAPFRIISLEKKYSWELTSLKMGRKLSLGGYIDRLDEKNGSIRVIDYKTGRAKNDFKDMDDLFVTIPSQRNQAVFQTFLYSLILKKQYNFSNILPALFFVRNIYKPDFDYHIVRTENRTKTKVTGFGEYSEVFEEKLADTIDEMYDENIPFTQTEDIRFCANCPYNAICMRKI
jgi:CRISPR/Cas system-associated exonuclease Cas4 (RecB family)